MDNDYLDTIREHAAEFGAGWAGKYDDYVSREPARLPAENWLVDFYDAQGNLIETKEVKRAYAPSRWARNHVLTLRRARQGAEVTYSITRMS